MNNHCQTLGLFPPFDLVQLKSAYKDLAKLHHPDRGGDPNKMIEINTAYEALKKETELSPAGRYEYVNVTFTISIEDYLRQQAQAAKAKSDEIFRSRVDLLIKEQIEKGYKPGWIIYQVLKVYGGRLSLDNWIMLGEKLNYKPQWAYHKFKEYS